MKFQCEYPTFRGYVNQLLGLLVIVNTVLTRIGMNIKLWKLCPPFSFKPHDIYRYEPRHEILTSTCLREPLEIQRGLFKAVILHLFCIMMLELSGIRNQESFIRGNLQYMQFTKGYIQYRVIWSNIHLCGLEISIKASRRYHGNHQEKSMSNDEAPCKHSISCIYKNYQSLVISNLIKSFLSDI